MLNRALVNDDPDDTGPMIGKLFNPSNKLNAERDSDDDVTFGIDGLKEEFDTEDDAAEGATLIE